MELQYDEFDSPVGPLLIACRGTTLVRLEFDGIAPERGTNAGGIADRLRAYFAGDLGVLERIDVDPDGTPFQKAVWQELRNIPAGRTISYGELAKRIGRPTASRAVGAANGRNPIPIVIPCHRVIGSDSTLIGYGGGIDRKRWLLSHERSAAPPRFTNGDLFSQ